MSTQSGNQNHLYKFSTNSELSQVMTFLKCQDFQGEADVFHRCSECACASGGVFRGLHLPTTCHGGSEVGASLPNASQTKLTPTASETMLMGCKHADSTVLVWLCGRGLQEFSQLSES